MVRWCLGLEWDPSTSDDNMENGETVRQTYWRRHAFRRN